MESPILKDNILFLRNRCGWSQTQLAVKLGINHKSTVQHWEYGDNTPSIHMCLKLSKVFQVRLDYLVTLDLAKVDPLYLELHRRNRNVSLEEKKSTEQLIDTEILDIARMLHQQEVKIPAFENR